MDEAIISFLPQPITANLKAVGERQYNIYVKRGIFSAAGELIRSSLNTEKVFVISDDTVFGLYGKQLRCVLEKVGLDVREYIIEDGETSKSADNLIAILNAMARERITRSDCVVALGGGVVGDIAGFASAIYLRGIQLVNIPTTLLAMVDSSVGGKTAIDLDEGKNLAGAFWHPSLVICDPDLLTTLPTQIFAEGCAEVIKYAFINDKQLFDALHFPIEQKLTDIICMCINDKRVLVEADERDCGARRLLNFGHTVGHAIEACSNYKISHGNAVAVGMVIITRAAEKQGICFAGTLDALIQLLTSFGLPVTCDYSAEQLFEMATTDKKREGSFIDLVAPCGIADSRLMRIPVSQLKEFIEIGLN